MPNWRKPESGDLLIKFKFLLPKKISSQKEKDIERVLSGSEFEPSGMNLLQIFEYKLFLL